MAELISRLRVTPIAHGVGPIRATTAILGEDSVYLQVADESSVVSMGIHPSVARELAARLLELADSLDPEGASDATKGAQ